MIETRISAKTVVEGQIPLFMQEEYPLFGPFLKQYYESQDHFSSPITIVKNIDQFLKIGTYTSLIIKNENTVTTQFVDYTDSIIYVESTAGWPDRYGLLKINDEIITYTGTGSTSFNGCIRGFSGITTYNFYGKQVSYETTENNIHEVGSNVENLSTLFLKEFFKQIKSQFLPGFDNIDFYGNLKQPNLLIQSKDFYSTKGTPVANNILFKSLYGEEVETIKPQDYLLKPSANDYRLVRQLVVSPITGDPLDLSGGTLFQEVTTSVGIRSSYGSVSDVEPNFRGSSPYYTIDVDFGYDRDSRTFGSIVGNFQVHPITKVVSIASSSLFVDSTVGFANSGSIQVDDVIVTYNQKTNSEFLNCVGISTVTVGENVISSDYITYGFDSEGNRIEVRITGVLEKLNVKEEDQNYYQSNDPVLIESLGIIKDKNDSKFNSWKFNTSTKFNVNSIVWNGQYFVVTSYDDHNLYLNDDIQFVNKINNNVVLGKVRKIISDKKFQASVDLDQNSSTLQNQYFVRRSLKISSNSLTENRFKLDIQDVYDNESDVLVTSASLPSYLIEATNRKKDITIAGITTVTQLTIPNHNFYSGDLVYVFSSTSIVGENRNYVVKRIDSNSIKLALSNSNITNELYYEFSNLTNSPIILTLVPLDNFNKQLTSQKLVRKLDRPTESLIKEKTVSDGRLGILVNGVEILNYKAKEVVYHGPIESIDILDGGEDYDVINPPIVNIEDSTGVGATGRCAVKGSLKSIEIIENGFDYLNVPTINISGGNGSGAVAEAKLSQIYHDIYFNAAGVSTSLGGFISTTSNFIGFNTEHKFNNGESIIYNSFNGTKIGIGSTSGDVSTKLYLQDNSVYFVSVIDDQKIKLHNNENDAIKNVNEVNITSPGTGNQRIRATRRKNILTSINVINSGSGYENKLRTVNSLGINTANNSINISNHDFKSGEIVTYSTSGTPIVGLDTSINYYVIKLDDDNFRLAAAGIGTTVSNSNYLTNQYAILKTRGSSTHTFNYPPITVSINGNVGVSRTTISKYQAIVNPIFRGSITSIQVTNGGTGYGSTDIINFDKQPSIILNSGSNAVLKPIIEDDYIKDVIVLNSGKDYNSSPTFTFNGGGEYAKLSPTIIDGKITSIKVVNGGIGFSTNKSDIVISASGKNARVKANIKNWTINLVEKYKNLFSQSTDDGLIIPGIKDGLQYVNLFVPRKLRENLPSKNNDGSNNYNKYDLVFDTFERLSTFHSPIIGWAYDGNPIYGPYGYSTETGGEIRAMVSGYQLLPQSDRPEGFFDGFFIEDYTFTNSGDLDEHNGRFCKTPDYPEGVYAYFATINPESDGFDTSYLNYRRPVFPYLIGNTYKSKTNQFNFLPSSNQENFDLTEGNYIKNTYPYKLNNVQSEYEFITQPFKISQQLSVIDATSKGSVENIGITSIGKNYKVGDTIVFDNTDTNGRGVIAKINEVVERRVLSLESGVNILENVSLNVLDRIGNIEGITTIPHTLSNLDIVNISKISDERFSNLSGFYGIDVLDNKFTLSVGVGTTGITGITTFLYFVNSVNEDNLTANDVLKITNPGVGTEKLLVLDVDSVFNRVKVKREHDGTTGYAYSAYTTAIEDPRRFTYSSGLSTTLTTSYRRKIFFNPETSVAIGTVGSGTTINIPYGFNTKEKFVPLQSIYLPNHNLITGQKLIYSNEGNTSISVFDNISGNRQLSENSEVYVAKFSDDLIGISTLPIGIGSTGGFVGIGSTANVLYFNAVGSGVYHSFKTQENELTSSIQKVICTLTTKQNHGLSKNAKINLTVLSGITTSIVIKYNSANRRLVANPKSFGSSGINTLTDAIIISDHNYKTGNKVIYTSSNPATGLINDKIYYVVRIDKDSFKLVDSFYQTTISNPNYINITGTGSGHELSEVNPPLELFNGNTVNFDLSDSSLSDLNGGTRVQSFDFDLYESSLFTNKFITSLSSDNFEVKKIGTIGVTNDAKLTLNVSNNVRRKLYYKLTPLIGKTYLTKEKSEIIIDEDVFDFNTVNIVNSKFNGSHTVTGIGSTTLTFNLESYPERLFYTENNSLIEYKTKEIDSIGSISNIEILFGGVSYESLPGISSITSANGSGAILSPKSNNIGKIIKSTVQTPGFEYPSDPTLKPIAQLPTKLQIEQLYTIESVGLFSGGKNYSVPPSFIVIDSVTEEVNPEVKLQADLSGNTVSNVRILENTKTLYGSPKILAVNNNNGIGITNISFNSTTKIVTINLATGFSTSKQFPFKVGGKILIEGIGIVSTGSGYNSSEYNYELFTLTGVTSAIGGSTGVLNFKLDKGINPGIFSELNSLNNGTKSFGRIVPEEYLPIFNPTISFGTFKYNKGEDIYIGNEKVGTVINWNPVFKLLKINYTPRKILPGEIIRGGATDNRAIIVNAYSSNGDFTVNSFNQKLKDYSKDTGKLSTFLQVLQDGDYYQNFSYSLKSKVPIEKWNDKVDLLTHTSGFKKFSDLQVISEPNAFLNEVISETSLLIDIIQEKDFDCYENFAFADEFTKSFNNSLVSNEIYFDYLKLLDYTEFKTNRVLKIDDISSQFDDTPSIFNYAVVGTFDITKYNSAQFYLLIKDTRYYGEKEIIIVDVIYDNSNGYLTAYGRNETVLDLGDFSFRRSGNNGEILFYPKKYQFNSYNISNVHVDIANTGSTAIGSTSLGNVVSFSSTAINIASSPTPIANTFVSISTNTYSSSKIIFSASNSNDEIQFGEINITHNGNDASYQIFAELKSGDFNPIYENGNLGDIDVTTSSGNVLIRFTPKENMDVNIRAFSILMGGSSSTGVGSTVLYKAELSSHYVSIASSTSPVETPIAGFTSSLNDGAHYYVQVHDTTNNRIQFSEVILINDSEYNPAVNEYAVVTSNVQLGTIGAAKSTSNTNLTFTPLPNIDVQVRTYQKTLSNIPKINAISDIDLNCAFIESDTESLFFEGIEISTKKEFGLAHRSSPIFKKIFDGSSLSVIDIESNTIRIPNHFFVTGEKIDYSSSSLDTRIGIGSTFIAGIGTTSFLPSTIYAVKLSDSLIQVTDTAEKALKKIPEILNISSVGIGTSHVFASNYKSNSKALICIDNIIQSPIIPTNRITSLSSNVEESNGFSFIDLDDVTGFYARDLVKIDDEFILLYDIGIGGTNRVYCRREQFGTIGTSHSLGTIVTKYSGDYNIVNDVIYFIEAPHGGDPNNSERESSFQGRIFLRSEPVGSSVTAYYNNYVFDDISNQFNGIRDVFQLTSQGENISGIVSSSSVSAGILLINNTFQKPKYPAAGIAQTYTYEVIGSSGISSVLFSGNKVGLTTTGLTGPMKFDINTAGIPRGGIVVSVGSTQGYGFQPLVSAGGTAIVSIAGTIQSISIGNSGSGYRPGIQTSIVVSIATSAGNISIGTALANNGHIVSIAVTNIGSGYTTTNPPEIIIDAPLNYENISLIYDSSNTGVGTECSANIVVGFGNSITEFTIINSGYGYSTGDILTVPIGGSTGIPTYASLSYRPFQITVDEVFNDSFSAWYPGQFVVLDDFDSEFDGSKRTFKLKENGELQNFISARGSSLQLDQNILIFINDILQVPGESYKFDGGSQVEFYEPPKFDDKVKVLFFKGSDVDVNEVEVEPTIKVGDKLTLVDRLRSTKDTYTQSPRVVSEISFIDAVFTNPYFGPGINSLSNVNRTIEWCKQKEDFYLDETLISKSREELNCNIFPITNIISSVGVGSTVIFVENTRLLFNYTPEILPASKQILNIINQNEKQNAIATAIVSIAGTISNIIISNGGVGFTTNPTISISTPSSGSVAIATCTISGIGTISSVTVTNPGSGYTTSNPPKVLIECDPLTTETITNVLYEGDFGIITGIGTTNISGLSTGITFDFFIPKDSVLRNINEVGSAVTMSGIQTGYYFVISQSNIGRGITSLNNDSTILGIGSTYVDNVYQAYKVENVVSPAIGIGNTNEILRVTANVSSFNNLTDTGTSQIFGRFSWGRISNIDRGSSPQIFNVDLTNGISGLNTAPLIIRATPMRSLYTS